MSNREPIDSNFQLAGRSIRESGLLAAGTFAACVAVAALASTLLTPKYTADAKLLFTKVDRTAALAGLGTAETGQLQSLLMDQTPLTTEIQVMGSTPILEETITTLNLKDADGNTLNVEDLEKKLKLRIVGGTDVIEVLYTDPDPQIAAAVPNTLIASYRERQILNNRSEAREAKDFLLAQLPQTEAQVRQADAELRNFLQQNNIGVLDAEATSLVARMEVLSNQIATAQANLAATASQANTLQNKLKLNSGEAYLVGTLSQNPGIQEAIAALQVVERDLASNRARLSPSSPVIRQLSAQQASLQSFLQQEINRASNGANVPVDLIQANPGQLTITQGLIQTFLDNEVQYSGLEQQLEVLKGYQAEYQQRLLSVPSLSAAQRELERRVTVAEETYQVLLTRIQDLQVRENEVTYNSRVIQPASVPLKADSGGRLRILAAGVMGGAVLAIAIIVLSELLRPSALSGSLKSASPMKDIKSFEPKA
jgi:polysaccharide biosynthesis transport protein